MAGAAIVMVAGLLTTPAIMTIWLRPTPASLADLTVAWTWAFVAGAVAAPGVLMIRATAR